MNSIRSAPRKILDVASQPYTRFDTISFNEFLHFASVSPDPGTLITIFVRLKCQDERALPESSAAAIVQDLIRQALQIFDKELKHYDGMPSGGAAEAIAKLCQAMEMKVKLGVLKKVNDVLKEKEVELEAKEKMHGIFQKG